MGWIIIGIVLLLCICGYVIYLIRLIRRQSSPLSFTDHVAIASFATGFFLNLVFLIIAIVSLKVAFDSYTTAMQGGEEQLKALQEARNAIVSTGADQKQSLEESRKVLDRVISIIKKEYAVLENSYKISASQLDIIKEQRRRELEQPDVHLALFYTDNFSVQVINKGKKIARDTLYQGLFLNLSRPSKNAFQWANAIPTEVKYIRPGSSFSPTEVTWHFGNGDTPLKQGDRLFGYMSVQCTDCVQDRIYWVYFEYAGEGSYSEGSGDAYSMAVLEVETSVSKFLNTNGRILMHKGNFIH